MRFFCELFVFIGQFFDSELQALVLTGEVFGFEGCALKQGFVLFFGFFKGAFADSESFTCDGWFTGMGFTGADVS